MKSGKASNTVLKRSVFKYIKKRGQVLQAKPSVGSDCAVLDGTEAKEILLANATGRFPVYVAANNIAAKLGSIVAVQCGISISEDTEEASFRAQMIELERQCQLLDIPISGGHTQVEKGGQGIIVHITGVGYGSGEVLSGAKAGQDVVAFGHIGVSGVRQLVEMKRNEIQERFREEVIEIAVGNEEELLIQKAVTVGVTCGISHVHDVSYGGIFGALWDMAEHEKLGLDIDFQAIPVRQEVIELCELLDVNPYELESIGCGLMTTECGSELVRALQNEGIPAAVIGRTTGENQKIIRNREEMRYLDSPQRDEIFRFL